MLIQARYRDAIVNGEVTLTFRRWKRPQVVAGNTYRTGAGRIVVDAIDVVDPERITNADARRAGFATRVEVVAALRGGPDLPTYRIRIHAAADPDPRALLAATVELTPGEADDIARRLARLDRASSHGAWTAAVLRTIAERPAVRAADLAATFGRETQPFKIDVRKLKNLGLTLSLEVGYRLSPRGEAYLAATQAL
ncbi:MAG: hypothetical protein QOJ71_712 [Actinomycetota bacterium]|nr:hypothetical protein [Actinomycetota bacterium]